MIDFALVDNRCKLVVDLSIFNEHVLSKVVYFLTEDYLIYQQNLENNHQSIIFEKKQGVLSDNEFRLLKEKINQLLIDYKNRDIINMETKNIRDILYIKAFANNDDYEDFNLMR
jgi:His-Xaa-Ser system protein HxsD